MMGWPWGVGTGHRSHLLFFVASLPALVLCGVPRDYLTGTNMAGAHWGVGVGGVGVGGGWWLLT